MANVKIEVTDADVNRAIGRTLEALLDLREPLDSFGEYLIVRTRENFDAEQEPDGTKWAPISTAWIKQKEREGRPTQIGVYTRQLRDFSFSYVARRASLVFGSAAEHAPFFHFGTRRNGSIGRPIVGLARRDREELISTLADWIT